MKNKFLHVALIVFIIIFPYIFASIINPISNSYYGTGGLSRSVGGVLVALIGIPIIATAGFVGSIITKKTGKKYIWSITGYLIASIITCLIVLFMYFPNVIPY